MVMDLYHVSGFRSTRVVCVYNELRRAYPIHLAKPKEDDAGPHNNENLDTNSSFTKLKRKLPILRVHTFYDKEAFRTNKPSWYLEMNPNGKVPFFRDYLNNDVDIKVDGQESGNAIFTDLTHKEAANERKQNEVIEIF